MRAVERTQQAVPYFRSFVGRTQTNDLDDIGQGHGYCTQHATMIICVKWGKNLPRPVRPVKRTPQDVPYLSNFIANSWLNYLEDIGQRQRSLCATHPLIVTICGKYGEKICPELQACAVFRKFYWKFMVEWPLRYRSKSKILVRDTPSHASDNLCLIWKKIHPEVQAIQSEHGGSRRDRQRRLIPIYPLTSLW